MTAESERKMSARKRSTAKPGQLDHTAEKVQESGKDSVRVNTRVRNYRRHAKSEIAKSFREICQALVEEAKRGSIGHTKLLFDVGGVKEDANKEGKKRELSLGALLLKELEDEQNGTAIAQSEPEAGQ